MTSKRQFARSAELEAAAPLVDRELRRGPHPSASAAHCAYNPDDMALSRIVPAVIKTPSGKIKVFLNGKERKDEQ
jgi:hypothetical protein